MNKQINVVFENNIRILYYSDYIIHPKRRFTILQRSLLRFGVWQILKFNIESRLSALTLDYQGPHQIETADQLVEH